MASAQTGEQFFVFLREDGVLCEDVEIKIEVTHDVCQTVDNGEALGPLFVKIDENPVPVTVIKQKAVGFSRDQTLFLLSQMSAKVDILFDGGKARSMAELRDRMSARRGGMKKFWLDVASTLSKAFSLIFDAEKVRRKWQTLCDGYKNYVDNHNKTGSARSKFEWKDQMEELLGERHDVRPVVTASRVFGSTDHWKWKWKWTQMFLFLFLYQKKLLTKQRLHPPGKKKTKKTDRFAEMLAHMKTTDEAMLQILRTSTETFERIGNSLVSALNAGRASNN
ncbi:hypothetical protein CAPTEDRAFT_208549 [Capitella teleta]|uniref:MADF domain-containing protein n=1 Tax=Capitella teleta TaxID=283909 RepID=R7TJT3_CAPTE|nr:hypothetical protein CAPTEDRAFT_208549 [Capitella teleta]|eukprot:ELT93974.1 hypothetical protein CAPTEDRAFT_208549 [Capitella teleta]